MSRSTKKANRASSSALSQQIQENPGINDKNYSFAIFKPSELSATIQSSIWDLFKENMEWWYRSTDVFKWDPTEKRAELFHRSSRFLLVTEQGRQLETLPVAYSMFRFDVEEDMEGNDEDVLYCYELQVYRERRGQGLGKILVNSLDLLGRQWSMKKIMLTVLTANVGAIRFYQREGFVVDSISPKDDGYIILSKELKA